MTAAQHEQDVVDLLLGQHDEIREQFAAVRTATGEQRQDAFQQLVRLLAVHESAEEQVVHPMARREGNGELVDARLREEDDAKTLLAELYDMGVDGRWFDDRFAALEAAVLEHAAHEESEEFPALRAGTDPAKLRRMAGAVRAAEAFAPKRPHPEAGVHPVTNLLAGPPVALFDKVREAVGEWRSSHDD